MVRILTVDDSRAIRSIVTKQVTELGYEVDEAEHGEDGLAKLEDCLYDLVLLDVTMPVLDGPGMLAKMREAGNKTPVLMLTSESKRSIVASVLKLGIDDYILKPFKPEELRAKILKSLRAEAKTGLVAATSGTNPSPEPAPLVESPGAAAAVGAAKSFADVLVVDDMENVHKKLRVLLPQHVTMNSCASAHSALASCRDKVYRVILLDTDIPDVTTTVILSQLRALQPHASILGLCLRTSNDAEKEVIGQGFDGVLFKPFDPGSVEDFLVQYFDDQELLTAEDNLVHAAGFQGREERIKRYFQRLEELMAKFLEKSAAACHDEVIFDVSHVPARADRTPGSILSVDRSAKKLGIALRLVGTPELGKILRDFTETASVPFFSSVAEARKAS
jgi:DNA-binding response OmpR family regulator